MEQKIPPTERQLTLIVRDAVAAALPRGWSSTIAGAAQRSDVVLEVVAPDGRSARLPVAARKLLAASDVPLLAAQYADVIDTGQAPILASRYASPRAREALADSGLSYVDATGNLRVSTSDPGLFLERAGADRDPWRTADQPMTNLRGIPGARIVRALADREAPWRIRELAKFAGTSLGSTSRTVALLEREALLTRGQAGEIATVDWPALLERWASDYDLGKRRRTLGLLQPRPLDALNAPLQASGQRYAITGSLAAAQWAPYAQGRMAIIYTEDLPAVAAALDLREAPSRPNVLLIEPNDDYVFERAQDLAGLRFAAPSQVAVDLLNGPGCNPEEGQQLLRWMRVNEADWRAA